MYCCTLLYVHSSIAIILMGKRELIALLNLSSWCLVMVERLFLAVPRGCLQFVIVVFPDHTHLLFLVARKLAGGHLCVRQLVFWLMVVSSSNYFKMHAWSTTILLLLHSAFMLSIMKLLLKGEVGVCALKSWKLHC